MAAAKATQIASLIDLPNDVVLNLGAFVSPVEISNIITAATFRVQQPNAKEPSEGAPRSKFGNSQWPRVVRLLLAGRTDGVVLPPRLKDILYNGMATLFMEGDSAVLSQSSESLQNFCKGTFALLLQYSKLAVDLTLSIRSPIDDSTDEAGNRMLWPMGCGSASSDGGYNWPIFVFSTPHWHPKLVTLGKGWMLDHDPHNAMILNGTFIRPEHLQDKFIPDKNMGVLTWHRNDEDLFERDIKYGGTGSENNYNLYVTYQMFSTFSSGKHILLWTTQRVLEAENSPFLEVIAQKMKESSKVSWLQEAILAPGPSPKHSVCFWVETEGREEQRPRPFRSRSQRLEPPSANKGLEDDPNDFSDEEILQEIRGLVDRLCVVPPLDTDISRFVGSWKLLEAFDAESNALFPIPQGTFIMKLAEVPGVSHQLHFSIRVGNSMGCRMTFLSVDNTQDEATNTSANLLSIHIGYLMSTAMYCPGLHDLEVFLNQKLPKMTSVELFEANQNAGEALQLKGGPGSFKFLKVDSNVEPIGT